MGIEDLDHNRIALGIRQPWAELILRGIKTLEIRSRPTKVRGPIYLYTSKAVSSDDFAQTAIRQHGLTTNELTCGMIVGTISIADCRPATSEDAAASCVPAARLKDHFAWVLTDPEPLREPQPVRFLPYGVWFYPYRRRGST